MFWVYCVVAYFALGYIASIIYSVGMKLGYKEGKKVFEDGSLVPPAMIVFTWPVALIIFFGFGVVMLLTSVIGKISDAIVDKIKGK